MRNSQEVEAAVLDALENSDVDYAWRILKDKEELLTRAELQRLKDEIQAARAR